MVRDFKRRSAKPKKNEQLFLLLQIPRRSHNEPGHELPRHPRAPSHRDPRAAEADHDVPVVEPGTPAHAPVQDAADGHRVAGEGLRVTHALCVRQRRRTQILSD